MSGKSVSATMGYLAAGSLLLSIFIAEEYHFGAVRRTLSRFFGWTFAWVWEIPFPSLPSMSSLWSFLFWVVVIVGGLIVYTVLGSLATGVIVGIVRRLKLNPSMETQVSFLLFWPPVLLAALIVGSVRGIAFLLTPVCRMLFHEGVKGVDKPLEIATGKEMVLRRDAGYIEQPVSLFDDPK